MGSGLKMGKSPLFGLPVDPFTAKLNKALGLTPKEEDPPAPLAPTPSPVTKPEGLTEDLRKKRGRRLTVLTAGSNVPEGKSLLNSEEGTLA